jgi:uncharacterized protein YjdB
MSRFAAAVATAACLAACSSDKSTSPNTSPTKIDVPTSLSLVAGTDTTIAASVEDAGGDTLSTYDVMYTSSDTTVVKVGTDGTIMAVGAGTATLTAYPVTSTGSAVSGVQATIAVTVTMPSAASISIANPVDSLAVGDSTMLMAAVLTATGDTISSAPITWTSSDTTLATVSDSGMVRAVAAGAVVITAATGTLTAEDSVTVVPAATPNRAPGGIRRP